MAPRRSGPRTLALGRHRRTRGQRHPPSRERNDRRRGLVVAPGRTVAVVRRLPRPCKISDTDDNGHRPSFAPVPAQGVFANACPGECGGAGAEMACSARVVVQAQLVETERGLVPEGDGWFVLNARAAQWWKRRVTVGDFEGEPRFRELGVTLPLLEPGEPWKLTRYRDDWLPD